MDVLYIIAIFPPHDKPPDREKVEKRPRFY